MFFFGLLLANSLLLYASFIPIFIYMIGVSIPIPKVECRKQGIPSSALIGEILDVQVACRIIGGLGLAIVYDELPRQFELVEGSNYKVITKGFHNKELTFSYKARCTKRGNYFISGVRWEARHILGLKAPQRGSSVESKLAVHPRLPYLSRIRTTRIAAYTTQPMESRAKIGVTSTDFKEIRNYVYGDPFKTINWKASVRLAVRGTFNPLVNEYEHEGRQSVWIFLDAHPEMNIGTSVENVFEYATQAAMIIAFYFLKKGFRLGMYVYNDLGKTFYPDAGKKPFIKISKEMLEVNPTGTRFRVYWQEGLSKALEKNRKYLISLSPFIVIITHVTPSRVDDLLSALEMIWKFRKSREEIRSLIVNVLPYGLIPKVNELEVFSAKILETRDKVIAQNARNIGARVLNWNPREENFGVKLVEFLRMSEHW
jgi:uncharacterized protein (DUF58 family)